MKRRALAAPVLALVLVGSTSCTSDPAQDGVDSDALSMSLNTDPSTFDPVLARGGDDFTVARFLYSTLLHKDTGNTLVGGLATSWTTVDAAHYVLTLRKGTTCADGTPITASVVADSLRRFADPATGSTGRSLAFGGATATFAPDDTAGTVSVALSQAWADFLPGLTLPQSGVVCPAGLRDTAALAKGSVTGAFSGPYTLSESNPAVSYRLALRKDFTAWPEYAEPVTGRTVSTLTLRPITDYTTIATQLTAGDLDVGVVSDQNVNRFTGDDRFSVLDSVNTTAYLQFNERPGTVFSDRPDLRKAVAQVVQASVFSDIATDGRGEAILSVGAPALPCVNTDATLLPAHDPSAASGLLRGVKIRVVGTTLLTAGNEYVAEVLRNAGADVTVQSLDNATWSTLTSGGGTDWDINVQGDQNVLGTLTSSLLRVMGPASEDGGRNKGAAGDDAGYAALTAALATADADQRCADLQTAQRSALERVDAVPLSTIPTTNVLRRGVSIRVVDDYLDPTTLRVDG